VIGYDPSRDGVTVVETASGATYLIEADDPDRPATLTRSSPGPMSTPEYPWADLRRDGEPIVLLRVEHVTMDGQFGIGLVVGAHALFILEPLDPRAGHTERLTTPVRSITRLEKSR
jgi:hypothetical protein